MHIVSVAGLTCSGKSTLAQLLSLHTGGPVISLDDYYLPFLEYSIEDRKRMNFDAPEMFDSAQLACDLEQLANGEVVDTPVYDFVEFTRAPETRRVEPHPVVILEGQYALFWPEINSLAQTRVFLDVDPMECLNRRIHRDVAQRGRTREEVQWRFMRHVLPMFERYVDPSRASSTLILHGTDPEESLSRVMQAVAVPARVY